ncbi:hypothetical protein KO533_19140 [Shewanella sp. NKUCC05_KAH]|uniref:hypothetical protein n=1 Tax=Shewanella sp. NKUCC05_KAH TaxID=2842126 RepID=UPI001C5A6642|nr:hypothetical protein [Shewanella sp. NKUCC05_KAH]MBW3528664.1 hypothetical protein [Shewanella sp. NKUCC05_KAH]
MEKEAEIYQRIGEFVVSFQWIENKLREIGWFILDPERREWPPKELRNLTNNDLINKVDCLFKEALPKCKLDQNLETEIDQSFSQIVKDLHQVRKDRNRILHSAFIEIKAGGDVQAIIRSNPSLGVDEETGEPSFDQEALTSESFALEMQKMAVIARFLSMAYIQLIHRYPNGGA